MSEEKYTRCPGCHTVFRVTTQQLALRGGQVRCGHCKTVFDGPAELISLAPRAGPPKEDDAYDEAALGPPTVTLRSAQALHPAPPEQAPATVKATVEEKISEIAYEERFARARPRKPRGAVRAIWGAAIPVLLVALMGQTLFHFRDALAAHWPASKPVLSKLCEVAGCAIRPLRDVANFLSIEASDLQADPSHKGLLILTASVRNRASWPLAYPYLELTLTDAADAIVVRRALPPSDYAGGTVDIGNGIAPNGEVAIKLFIDASATTQAGYRLYLFYP
jgi:predicted Zn finger-like uncharacterized protein